MVKIKCDRSFQAMDHSTIAYDERMVVPKVLCLCESQFPIGDEKGFNLHKSSRHHHQKLERCDDRTCLLVFLSKHQHVCARDAMGLNVVEDEAEDGVTEDEDVEFDNAVDVEPGAEVVAVVGGAVAVVGQAVAVVGEVAGVVGETAGVAGETAGVAGEASALDGEASSVDGASAALDGASAALDAGV